MLKPAIAGSCPGEGGPVTVEGKAQSPLLSAVSTVTAAGLDAQGLFPAIPTKVTIGKATIGVDKVFRLET
jgi:hypothetical protein